MLYTLVGKTGSGKSLLQSYWVYSELDKIKNNDVVGKWWNNIPIVSRLLFLDIPRSYYDMIAMNSDFNDGRGNFVKYRHENEECICEEKKEGVHWCSGGLMMGLTDLDEVRDKKNLLVFLDEAGTQFSNHDWDKMPEWYRLFLTSHRHNVTHLPKKFDIWVLTQHRDIIEITLKRVSLNIFLVRPLMRYSKNPFKDPILPRLRGIRLWVHWEHELLNHNPIQVNKDGDFEMVHPQDSLESLEPMTWIWFPSFGRKMNKYLAAYDTIGQVRAMKREPKQKLVRGAWGG